MFELNDVVRFKDTGTLVEMLGVITRVDSKDYVQILAENGRTFSAAYTGYLKKTGRKVRVSDVLEELALMSAAEKGE